MEKMNSYERTKAAIELVEVDRVPVSPLTHASWTLVRNRITIPESMKNPKLTAKAMIDSTHLLGFDAICGLWDSMCPAEACGCTVKIQDEGSVMTMAHPVTEDPETLQKLEMPDPAKDARFNVAIETSNLMMEGMGKEKYIYNCLCAPYTIAGALRGVEAMTLECITDPDYVKDIVKFTTEMSNLYYQYMIDKTHTMCVMIADPTASGNLISPEDFMRFSQPYLKECNKVLQANDTPLMIHICGDTNDRYKEVADIGCKIFSFDYQNDIALARREIGDRVCLLGKVNPAQTLYSGTEEASYNESIACIRDADGGKGFILGAGCEVPINSPIENVKAMYRAACEYPYR